eukprot:gene18663-22283_t
MSWWGELSISALQEKAKEALHTLKSDLQEFGSTVKEDTEDLVQGVQKSVPELLEKGDVALDAALPEIAEVQDHFENVGSQIESFGQSVLSGTTEIFAQVREAVQTEFEEPKKTKKNRAKQRSARDAGVVGSSGKYNRYESQVYALQRDSSTYCDEPEDKSDYDTWCSTFQVSEQKVAIEEILRDNSFMRELHSRIVPLIVEHEVFWMRYFYRLSKLQQREELVKRASKVDLEDDLSWDVEDPEPSTDTCSSPKQACDEESTQSSARASTKKKDSGVTQSSSSEKPLSQVVQSQSDSPTTGASENTEEGPKLDAEAGLTGATGLSQETPASPTKGKQLSTEGTKVQMNATKLAAVQTSRVENLSEVSSGEKWCQKQATQQQMIAVEVMEAMVLTSESGVWYEVQLVKRLMLDDSSLKKATSTVILQSSSDPDEQIDEDWGSWD